MSHNIKYGIKNLIAWLPVIWKDRDWDWYFLAKIMEFKLRKMSHHFKHYGHLKDSEKDALQMLICAELLKRLSDDDICSSPFPLYFDIMDSWQKMLGNIIGKKFRNWWD